MKRTQYLYKITGSFLLVCLLLIAEFINAQQLSATVTEPSPVYTVTTEEQPALVAGTVTPASPTAYTGFTISLSATPSSGGSCLASDRFTKWQYSSDGTNWSDIVGATSETSCISPPLSAGTQYFRKIVSCGSETAYSNNATVTVSTSPAGTITPFTLSVTYNTSPGQLSGTVNTGTYQWQQSTDGNTWNNISGATGQHYTPGALTSLTYYRRALTNGGQTIYSNVIKISTTIPPLSSGTATPTNGTVLVGRSIALQVGNASGGSCIAGTYLYQWQQSTDNFTWSTVAGASATAYTFAPTGAGTYYFRVLVSCNGANALSNTVTITAYPTLMVGSVSPASQAINYNAVPAALTSTPPTGGNGTYTYQWQSSPNNSTWSNIGGATSTTYTPPALKFTTWYRLLYTSVGVQVISAVATITVAPFLSGGILTSSHQTIAANTIPATITATAASGGNCGGSYSYQWEKSADNATFTTINGATGLNLSFTAALTQTAYYRRKTTCGSETQYTDAVQVAVIAGTGCLSGSQAIAPGGTVTPLIISSVSSGCTLTWYRSVDEINWTAISGITTTSYTPTSPAATTYYRVKISCSLQHTYSNAVAIKVKAATATIIPSSVTASSSQTAVPMPSYPAGTDTGVMNRIRTRTFAKSGIMDIATADAQTDKFDVQQVTGYFDGLGRSIQTLTKNGTPAGKDMILTTWYDASGRQVQKYLPYTDGQATGEFRMNPATQQPAFYNALFNNQEGFYYSAVKYETSPLDRTVKETGPGKSWTGSDRGKRVKQRANRLCEDVKRWTIGTVTGATPQVSGAYYAGELSVTEITDENENKILEYKNRDGQLVLKKIQASDVLQDGHNGWLCTYYVYDDPGNQRVVISPKGVEQLVTANWQLSATLLHELCFRYEYDQRQRMIVKKVPGAAEVWIVYDARDRQVLWQDGRLRTQATPQWLVTEYDELNRIVRTGLWNNTTNRVTHATAAGASISYPQATTGYEILTETYYDEYTYTGVKSYNTSFGSLLQAGNNRHAETGTASNQVKGLVTGMKVKVLGTASQYLFTTIYYDEKGRELQTQSDNITGGTDIITNQYSFSGKLLSRYLRHQKSGTNAETHTVLTKTEYDHSGRIINVKKILNSTPEKTITQQTYNELGQAKVKQLGQKTDGSFLETLDYTFNIQGWLTGINRGFANPAYTQEATAQAGRWFGMELLFDQGISKQQYNSNIGGIRWKSTGDDEQRAFGFEYDNMNRLLKADFTQYTQNAWTTSAGINFSMKLGDGVNTNSAYDANGNIRRLQQWGYKTTGGTQVDDMLYEYYASGNKLRNIREQGTGTVNHGLGDFTDKYTGADDYGYDNNGNLVTDLNKRINGATGTDLASGGAIVYNHLNLPQQIAIQQDNGSARGIIRYTYDAAGNKLQKTVTEGNLKTVTSYLQGFVYEYQCAATATAPDTLQFAHQEEGRIRKTGNGSYVYDYFVKDHLGNVRMVLTEESVQDIYPAATLEGDVNNANTAAGEEKLFYTIDPAKIALQSEATGITAYLSNNGIPNPYSTGNSGNTTQGQNSQKLYKLQAAETANGGVTGLGITLKVMAGDKINIFGKSYYFQQNTAGTNYAVPLSAILGGIFGSPGSDAAGKGVTAQQLAGIPAVADLITTFLTNPNRNNGATTTVPRAYINWLLLDDHFRYVAGNFSRVGTANTLKDHYNDLQLQNIAVPKNGFLYVYISNESPVKVFFDNLQVVHARGPLLEETHYYPFGLTMAGISSKALKVDYIENKKKFNGIEQTTELDLNQYDAFYRNLDPQTGRWFQVDPKPNVFESPYTSMGNNPVRYNDPLGDTMPSGKAIYEPGGYEEFMAFNDPYSERYDPNATITLTFRERLYLFGHMLGFASPTGKMATKSYWAETNALKRGLDIEKKLGPAESLLPPGFKTLDVFEKGVATSIKSIDLSKDTYVKGKGLFNALKGHVNKLVNYTTYSKKGITVEAGEIGKKVLLVAIKPSGTSIGQWVDIAKAWLYAKRNGVELQIRFVK